MVFSIKNKKEQVFYTRIRGKYYITFNNIRGVYIKSKLHYLISGLIGFMISLGTTTMSKSTVEILDIILAIFFGFLVVIFEYMRHEPSPFFKENEKDKDKK